MSNYDRLLEETKKSVEPLRKEIVEFLLSRCTDEGLSWKFIKSACDEALEIIKKKEEEFEW